MNQQSQTPPHISIRRANAKDKWEIKSLLLTWDDSQKTVAKNFYIIIIWIVVLVIVSLYNWLLAMCILAIYLLSEYTFKSYRNFWVIDANHLVLGCAELRNMRQYSLLFNVCIKRKHRYKKFGSCLIEHVIQQAQRPLYLGCYRELIPFYSRFGFTIINPNKLPAEIQLSLGVNPGTKIIPMVLR